VRVSELLLRCRLVLTHTHTHTIYIFIIVYDRFIRVTLPNGAAADRMIDGPQLDGADSACIYIYIYYTSFVRLSAAAAGESPSSAQERTDIYYIVL